jgi:hypothetical protein
MYLFYNIKRSIYFNLMILSLTEVSKYKHWNLLVLNIGATLKFTLKFDSSVEIGITYK